MYCLHPISVQKYSEKLDKLGKHVKTNNYHVVPCGKCVACLARRRSEWTYRLTAEQQSSDYSYFVTLTYDDAFVPVRIVDNVPYFVFRKSDVQKYIKRVRFFADKLAVKLKYFLVSEYGGHTHRPHYHAIFFISDKTNKNYKLVSDILVKEWNLGFVTIKNTNPANIHYMTKYCVKSLQEEFEDCIEDTFTLCSKDSYLGKGLEDVIAFQNEDNIYDPLVFFNGYPMAVPRIYRNKLGIGGMAKKTSPHPRLNMDTYTKFRNEYKSKFSSFDETKFHVWIDKKLALYEIRAKQNQLNRLEKL